MRNKLRKGTDVSKGTPCFDVVEGQPSILGVIILADKPVMFMTRR